MLLPVVNHSPIFRNPIEIHGKINAKIAAQKIEKNPAANGTNLFPLKNEMYVGNLSKSQYLL